MNLNGFFEFEIKVEQSRFRPTLTCKLTYQICQNKADGDLIISDISIR